MYNSGFDDFFSERKKNLWPTDERTFVHRTDTALLTIFIGDKIITIGEYLMLCPEPRYQVA